MKSLLFDFSTTQLLLTALLFYLGWLRAQRSGLWRRGPGYEAYVGILYIMKNTGGLLKIFNS